MTEEECTPTHETAVVQRGDIGGRIRSCAYLGLLLWLPSRRGLARPWNIVLWLHSRNGFPPRSDVSGHRFHPQVEQRAQRRRVLAGLVRLAGAQPATLLPHEGKVVPAFRWLPGTQPHSSSRRACGVMHHRLSSVRQPSPCCVRARGKERCHFRLRRSFAWGRRAVQAWQTEQPLVDLIDIATEPLHLEVELTRAHPSEEARPHICAVRQPGRGGHLCGRSKEQGKDRNKQKQRR